MVFMITQAPKARSIPKIVYQKTLLPSVIRFSEPPEVRKIAPPAIKATVASGTAMVNSRKFIMRLVPSKRSQALQSMPPQGTRGACAREKLGNAKNKPRIAKSPKAGVKALPGIKRFKLKLSIAYGIGGSFSAAIYRSYHVGKNLRSFSRVNVRPQARFHAFPENDFKHRIFAFLGNQLAPRGGERDVKIPVGVSRPWAGKLGGEAEIGCKRLAGESFKSARARGRPRIGSS